VQLHETGVALLDDGCAGQDDQVVAFFHPLLLKEKLLHSFNQLIHVADFVHDVTLRLLSLTQNHYNPQQGG